MVRLDPTRRSVDGDEWDAVVRQQVRMLEEYRRKLDGRWVTTRNQPAAQTGGKKPTANLKVYALS